MERFGMKPGDLRMPKDFSARVVQMRRVDIEYAPYPDLTIENRRAAIEWANT
jgi:hypothetical protein